MYRYKSVPYPNNQNYSGRYLGLTIDIGPAMTKKILRSNVDVVYHSTLQSLTQDEWSDPNFKRQLQEYNETLYKALGDSFNIKDL